MFYEFCPDIFFLNLLTQLLNVIFLDDKFIKGRVLLTELLMILSIVAMSIVLQKAVTREKFLSLRSACYVVLILLILIKMTS